MYKIFACIVLVAGSSLPSIQCSRMHFSERLIGIIVKRTVLYHLNFCCLLCEYFKVNDWPLRATVLLQRWLSL